jgi:hypothetical protein
MWIVIFVAVTVIFSVKNAVMSILFIFFRLTIESKNIELFCTQFNCYVYSLIHITLMFFIWSGNHKFYIQFLRLVLRLQSFIVTLYNLYNI